jgi:hypothetical protein
VLIARISRDRSMSVKFAGKWHAFFEANDMVWPGALGMRPIQTV